MTLSETTRILIETLEREGLLTADQAKRVSAAAQSGKDLTWALRNLPLVEPLQFMKAQRLAGVKKTGGTDTGDIEPFTPMVAHGAEPASGGEAPGSKAPLRPAAGGEPPSPRLVRPVTDPGILRERVATDLGEVEEVNTLDLQGDLDIDSGFAGIGTPLDPSAPAPATPPPVAAMPAASLGTLDPLPAPPARVRPPTDPGAATPDPQAYMRPGIAVPIYNLADDEGIPLVKRVNALLAEALDEGIRQVNLRFGRRGAILSYISEVGTSGRYVEMETAEGEKTANRLKIMARIEPWRKPPQKGCFILQRNRRQVRALLDILASAEDPAREELTLFFLPAN